MNYSSDIFDIDENEKIKNDLTELILSGEAVLFVGAGISKRLGFPDWKDLIIELQNFAKKHDSSFKIRLEKQQEKILEYVDDIKACICNNTCKERYYKLIQDLFKPKDPPYNEFHKTLVRLPAKCILTTNYDKVLESALLDVCPERDTQSVVLSEDNKFKLKNFVVSLNKKQGNKNLILHLHGDYESPESMILSAKDYKKIYDTEDIENKIKKSKNSFFVNLLKKINPSAQKLSNNHDKNSHNADKKKSSIRKTHSKLLWSFFATRRVVFLGCSIDDPYLKYILGIACSDLWNWGDCFHYAIIGIPRNDEQEASRLKNYADTIKEKYGICVYFYYYSGEDHTDLERLISGIQEKIENKSKNMNKQQKAQTVPASANLISNPIEGKKFSQWIKKTNKTMKDPSVLDENSKK